MSQLALESSLTRKIIDYSALAVGPDMEMKALENFAPSLNIYGQYGFHFTLTSKIPAW